MKLRYCLIPLIKMLPQRFDLLLQDVVTAFVIGNLLSLTTQATSDGVQLSGSLLETSVDTFIELEDKII